MSSISYLYKYLYQQVFYYLSLCTINSALQYKTEADQCKSSFHWITIRGQRKQNFYSIASEYELMKFGSVKRVYF